MNKKDIALEVLRFKRSDVLLGCFPAFEMSYYGANHEGYETNGKSHDVPVGTFWTDVWGVGWLKEQEGVMGFPCKNPISKPEMLKSYTFPDPNDERIFAKIYNDKKNYEQNYADEMFPGASLRSTVWERTYKLIGMENLMVYFYAEPNFVEDVMDSVMDFQLKILDHYFSAGATVFNCGDDLGTQNSLLLSPQIIETFLKPRYKKVMDKIKTRDGIINFHSCGHLEPILEMFIELKIDILNPVQSTANNLANFIKITEGRLALQGGISSHALITGSPDEIRRTTRETIALLNKKGGYFCGPDQGMVFNPENIAAMNDEIEKYNAGKRTN
jgi:Uroporphyrinogen-III decarboxylase